MSESPSPQAGTPRTDRAKFQMGDQDSVALVEADFARGLERELTASETRLAAMRRALEECRNHIVEIQRITHIGNDSVIKRADEALSK